MSNINLDPMSYLLEAEQGDYMANKPYMDKLIKQVNTKFKKQLKGDPFEFAKEASANEEWLIYKSDAGMGLWIGLNTTGKRTYVEISNRYAQAEEYYTGNPTRDAEEISTWVEDYLREYGIR